MTTMPLLGEQRSTRTYHRIVNISTSQFESCSLFRYSRPKVVSEPMPLSPWRTLTPHKTQKSLPCPTFASHMPHHWSCLPCDLFFSPLDPDEHCGLVYIYQSSSTSHQSCQMPWSRWCSRLSRGSHTQYDCLENRHPKVASSNLARDICPSFLFFPSPFFFNPILVLSPPLTLFGSFLWGILAYVMWFFATQADDDGREGVHKGAVHSLSKHGSLHGILFLTTLNIHVDVRRLWGKYGVFQGCFSC